MKLKFLFFSVIALITLTMQAFALSSENRPEYQREYDAYLQDLEVISQTGKAPVNPILEADLAKMSSNEKILLTAPQSADKRIYAQENAKILNRVEIIRVPEEFQEEYDAGAAPGIVFQASAT